MLEAAQALQSRVDSAAAWAFREPAGSGDAAAGEGAAGRDASAWAEPFPQLSIPEVDAALAGAERAPLTRSRSSAAIKAACAVARWLVE